jgi:hypothetical protein
LTQAVTSGDESAVSALLAGGADVNETTSGGQTALILAVIFGHTNLVRLLVKAGADPHLRDNLGLNAVEWAQRRGLTEALGILTNTAKSITAPSRIVVPVEQPKEQPKESVSPGPPTETEKRETPPSDEKSRRWLTGLKQRLDEIEVRKLNRKEPEPPRPEPRPEPHRKSYPKPRPEPRPEPRPIEEPPPLLPVAIKEAPIMETKPVPPAATAEPVARKEPPKGRILVPPENVPAPSGKRKRCPKCNATYSGDLVSYCAHHIVKLVDADEPIISQSPRRNPPLFWIMVIITLTGSIVVGSLITAYMYKSNQAAARSAQKATIQTGVPEVGGELAGKAVSLPEAHCPLTGPEPVSGTVIVRIMVDRKGQVYWARGSGGDWLMRGAATEAAMKSTFAPEKLRGRETEGTITYTFKP